jgi:cobalt-zinc-cadmium efflux system outer membrane protein
VAKVACRLAAVFVLPGLAACGFQRYESVELDHAAVPLATAQARLDDPALVALVRRVDAAVAAPTGTWTPAQLGIVAVSRSRVVDEARAAVVAARARQRVAVQRENPQLNLTVEHHSEEQDFSDSNWSIGPGFSLLVQPPSRRRLTGERSAAEVSIARIDLLDAAWRARDAANVAALDLIAQREQAALSEGMTLARSVAVDAARALVAAGVTDSFEWQTLALESNAARLDQLSLIIAGTAASADLAAALAVPLAALEALHLEPTVSTEPPPYTELQQEVLRTHPRVLRALAEYERAERDLALAVAAQYPAIELSPGYFLDQGDSVWSLFGGVVVPLFASHDAAIASAAAARDMAREHFHAEQAAMIAELQRAHANWRAAVQVHDAARGVAREVVHTHAELEAAAAEGIVDRLSVTRAALQVTEIGARLAACAAQERRSRAQLEAVARTSLLDPAFGRYLVELDTGAGTDAEGKPP